MRNSTIKPKTGLCSLCPPSKGEQSLIKELCQLHYWSGQRMKSAEKQSKKDIATTPGLPNLIDDADAVFSRWIRLSAADESGYIYCFICGSPVKVNKAQCMHYVKRGNLFLRYDERNCKAGCKDCNEHKDGNYVEYTRRLEEETPGITEILNEEGVLPHKPSREELRAIISEYTQRLRKYNKAF